MKTINRYLGAIMVVLLMATGGATAEKEFSSEEILRQLEDALQLSSEKLSELRPEIEARSEELRKTIDESVEQGFIRFDELSKNAEQKIQEFLTSEEYIRFKTFMGNIDKEAIDEAKIRIVTEVSALLELTEAQMKELKPVFEESLDRLDVMLKDLAAEGAGSWEKFTEQYEQLTGELRTRLQSILDEVQLEKLEKYNGDKKEKIKKQLIEV